MSSEHGTSTLISMVRLSPTILETSSCMLFLPKHVYDGFTIINDLKNILEVESGVNCTASVSESQTNQFIV